MSVVVHRVASGALAAVAFLSLACWAQDVQPQSGYGQVRARLQAAADLAKQAGDNSKGPAQRIADLLAAFRAEIGDPTPGLLMGTDLTASEMVQLRLIGGLSNVGDVGALRRRWDETSDTRLKDVLAIAAAMTSCAKDDPDQTAMVRRVMEVLGGTKDDFIGHMAASALEAGVRQQRSLRLDVVDALRSALDNPLARPDTRFWGDGVPRKRYLVRQSAGCALLRLGLDVDHDADGHWWLRDTDPAVIGTWWVEARPALAGAGFKVTWDSQRSLLVATRGTDSAEYAPGKKVAILNGREVPLKVAPRILALSLMVPEDALPTEVLAHHPK